MAVIIGSARHDEHGNCYSGGRKKKNVTLWREPEQSLTENNC